MAGSDDASLETALSSAPPDEWNRILGNMLGATVRPAEHFHQSFDTGDACTVTSILGAVGQLPEAMCHPAALPCQGNSGQARRRGLRTRQQRTLAASAALTVHKEDERSLEELLLDLGEGPQTGQKVKSKAQRPAAKAVPARQQVQVAPDKPVARMSENPRRDNLEVVDQEPEMPLNKADDEPDLAGSWQVAKGSKPSRRASQVASDSPQWESNSSATSSSSRPGNSNRGDEQPTDQSSRTTGSGTQQIKQEQNKLPKNLCNIRPTAGTNTSEQPSFRPLHEVPERHVTNDAGLLESSETSLGVEVTSASRSDTEADSKAWHCRPSVGTWLQAPLQLRTQRSLSEGARPGSHGECYSSEDDLGLSSSQAAGSPSWRLRPSVGTWLQPRDSSSQQEQAPALWPATPDSTPPTSPRGYQSSSTMDNQRVMWMPIPLHLVAEVQHLICSRTAPSCVP